jgi:hypothetical protein
MRYLSVTLLLAVLPALAEDFWKARPYTEWSEKEVKKLLTNSPWAKDVAASMQGGTGGGMSGMGGGRGGRGGRGGGGAAMPDASVSSMGGGGEANVGGGGTMGGAPGSPPQITGKVRFQNAPPVKQAIVRMRFGQETATSTQAQQILAAADPVYLVVLEGLPQRMAQGGGARLQQALLKTTLLKHGEKAPIAPVQVQIGTIEKVLAIYFAFPKTDAIVLEDKDVEFVSKIGAMEFKKKFKLADMVVDGKLLL